jgi:hypothetical protein
MSFWSNKPVSVLNDSYTNNPHKNIITNNIMPIDDLFEKSKFEIENSKIQLDYDVIINPDDELKQHFLNFINQNYISVNSNLTLIYSKDLLNYFISKDSLCIPFYTKGSKDKYTKNKNQLYYTMIGLIIGKKQNLYIKNIIDKKAFFKSYNSIDVDFLCIKPQLRNLHVSSYMINIMINKCITQYNKQVMCAIYTTNIQLKVNSFCQKTYYNRPLNIDNLLKSEIIFEKDNLKKYYNSFDYPIYFRNDINLEYFTTLQSNYLYQKGISLYQKDLCDTIYNYLRKYNESNYDIFEYKSRDDIYELLNNTAFHKFIIRDNSGNIKDFICLYYLETKNLKTNSISKNGYMYNIFLSNNDILYKSYILELISEYCYNNNIFDMILIMDTFILSEDNLERFKLIKTYPYLYYYIYNLEIPYILPFNNALVTI